MTGERPPSGRSHVEQLEETARRRFARWDSISWDQVLSGPAIELDDALSSAGVEPQAAESILRTYLQLATEGIGCGYLFPAAEAGVMNFFTLAWTQLIPKLLSAHPPERQAELLATCWNLGENLETAEPWIDRIFCRLGRDLDDLARLEDVVEKVSTQVLDEPPKRLGHDFTEHWIHLAADDVRFLPGPMHFVAPVVLCVHDRLRSGPADGAVTCGVWLSDQPLVLGAMDCGEEPTIPHQRPDFLPRLARDPRFNNACSWVANPFRGAAAMTTSQLLVTVHPA